MNTPQEVAASFVQSGKNKAQLPIEKMLILGLLAGMYIALGALASNTVSCTIENPSLARLVSACVFPAGLVMVLLAGSELFTSNCLMVISLFQREIRLSSMARNWLFVYLGNFLGSLFLVLLAYAGGQWNLFNEALALTTIQVAASKVAHSFGSAFFLGVGCNFLVCIAIWISAAAKDVVGKVSGLYLPIFIFVLAGFEHSVANMYYIPAGIIAAGNSTYAAAALAFGVDLSLLTWENFLLHNLLPVTLGNLVGGSLLVGLPYWYCYLHTKK